MVEAAGTDQARFLLLGDALAFEFDRVLAKVLAQARPVADYPPADPLEWWRLVDLTGIDREDIRLIVQQLGAAIEAGDVPAVRSLARLAVDVVRPLTCINPQADQVEALARFAYGLTGRERRGEFEVAFRLFRADFSDRSSYNAGLAAYARGRAAGDAYPATAGSTGLADGLRWLAEAAAVIDRREWLYYDWRRVRRLRAWIAQAQGQAVPVVYVDG